MTTDERDSFFSWAVQYYVAGRFAALAQLSPVCGNLFHHAIELCLKGYFARKFDEAQLARFKTKWSHHLPKIWGQFKLESQDPTLDRFDQTITKLDHFENIRYPDKIISEGANILIGIKEEDVSYTTYPKTTPGTHYRISIEEIDNLVKVIFAKASVNPLFFTQSLHAEALTYLNKYNDTGIVLEPSTNV